MPKVSPWQGSRSFFWAYFSLRERKWLTFRIPTSSSRHSRIFLPWRNVDFIFACMCEMNAGHDLLTPEGVACNLETQDSLKGRAITAHSYSSSAASGDCELINSCSDWLPDAVSSHLYVSLSSQGSFTFCPQHLDPSWQSRVLGPSVFWINTDEVWHCSSSPNCCYMPSDLEICIFRADCWLAVLPRTYLPFPLLRWLVHPRIRPFLFLLSPDWFPFLILVFL